MKKYLIEEPQLETRFLREVEPGMVLGDDCTSPEGQLLYQKNTVLSMDHIDKLKKFSVRRVTILTTNTRWVSHSELDEMEKEVEILDRKEDASPRDTEVDSSETETEPDSEKDDEPVRVWELTQVPESLETVLMRLQQSGLAQEDDELVRSLASVLMELWNEADPGPMKSFKVPEDTEHPPAHRPEPTTTGEESSRSSEQSPRRRAIEKLDTVIDQHGETIRQFLEQTFLSHQTGEGEGGGPDDLPAASARTEQPKTEDSSAAFPAREEQANLANMNRLFGILEESIQEFQFDSADSGTLLREEEHRGSGRDTPGDIQQPEELMGELGKLETEQAELIQKLHRMLPNPDQVVEALDWLREGEESLPSDLDEQLSTRTKSRMKRALNRRESLFQALKRFLNAAGTHQPGEPVKETSESEENMNPPGGTSPPNERAREQAIETIVSHSREGRWGEALSEIINQFQAKLTQQPEVMGRMRALKAQAKNLDDERERVLSSAGNDGPSGSDESVPEGDKEADPTGHTGVSLGTMEEHMEKKQNFLSLLEDGLQQLRTCLPEQHRPMINELSRLVGEDRSTPLPEQDQELYQEGKEERRSQVVQCLRKNDIKALARLTPHSPSTIQSMQDLYAEPSDIDKNQKHLLRPIKTMIERLFYLGEWRRDLAKQFIRRAGDVMESTRRPFYLYLLTFDPEQYLLPHAYNACLTGFILGEEQGLSEDRLERLVSGMAWMDLGMMFVPQSLFLHSNSLSTRGRHEINKHPLYSCQLLQRAEDLPDEVVRLVLEHHERGDGSGYPYGISEAESPLSRIAQHADVYSALLEPRPHRNAMLPDEALLCYEERMADPRDDLLEILRTRVGRYPSGSVVSLTDGRLGLVREQGTNPQQPRLLLLTDPDGNKLDRPETIELSEERGVFIGEVLRRRV